MVEAQRYLICVVPGFIAWAAGGNMRLQPRPINRSQSAREALYSGTGILVSGKSHLFFYANISDYGWLYFVGRWINTSIAHNIHHARVRHNFGRFSL